MRRFHLIGLLAIVLASLSMTSCSIRSIEADEEGVVIKKPWFFGHGGVEPEAEQTGSIITALSTSMTFVTMTPVTLTENFEKVMTKDNNEIPHFSAYIKLKVKAGQSPILVEGFGEKWYANSVAPTFRALVRDKASSHKMFELTSDRDVLVKIQEDVYNNMVKYCSVLKDRKGRSLPVEILEITIGTVAPSDAVLAETNKTAAQLQNAITQDAKAKAEIQRKFAEEKRAEADKSYQDKLGLTSTQWIELQRINAIRDCKGTVIIGNIPFTVGK